MKVEVNIETLESQLSETEMALLMAVNAALDAALLAGAPPDITIQHLEQHQANFQTLQKPIAAHMMAALVMLRRNSSGS